MCLADVSSIDPHVAMLAALQEENERPLPVLLTHQRKSQNRRGGLAVKPEMPQRPLLVKKKRKDF